MDINKFKKIVVKVGSSILIDKKTKPGHDYPKMFVVQYRFHDDLFYCTLFETELLRDNDNIIVYFFKKLYYRIKLSFKYGKIIKWMKDLL